MSNDKEAVIELERRRANAIGTGNLADLADVLDEDYLHVFAPGTLANKAEYVEMIKHSPRFPDRGELTVRLYGNVAVLAGDLTNRIGADEQNRRVIPAYCTQVAFKRNGKWRFVSYILTQKQKSA